MHVTAGESLLSFEPISYILLENGAKDSCGHTRNRYTMGCTPVGGDKPRALASGLSYVHVDNHGITILYHLLQSRPFTSRDIPC